MIDGFRPACAALYLIDADAALYADLNFPITLPPAELFEIKQARLTYTNDTGARADVVADITSIGVVPEPSSLALLGAGVAGLLTIRFGTSHRATTSRRA